MTLINFRKPLFCHFMLDSGKRKILEELDNSSDLARMQNFMEMVPLCYTQSRHMMSLSRWQLCAWKSMPLVFRHPFQFFLKKDAQNARYLSNFLLLWAFFICVVLTLVLRSKII